MSFTPPPQGNMYLFDSITPPLDDGSYRVSTQTTITVDGTPQPLSRERFFNIVGPRFNVPDALVAGVFPPSNAHGAFENNLPEIVLKRRTLPWERELDPEHNIPPPTHQPGDPPPPNGKVPWVALLLFEDGEYTYYRNLPLEQVVPSDVFARLGSPANIKCDCVEADSGLVSSILPSLEELQLLTHARWVNVDDRELNAAGGDGWYSVVVSNRLPTQKAKCRAVLVSLEERSDLVSGDPPAVAGDRPINVRETRAGPPVTTRALVSSTVSFTGQNVGLTDIGNVGEYTGFVIAQNVRLVALYSWQFTCEGSGTFQELMQGLDDEMMGTVVNPGHPALTDTGHLRITVQDRAGSSEIAWYRGPLVPYNLTRDPLGPYHSADQARRATPETGAEDVSYAAAFEVGRLLAAADARLAQAIMQWRREAYKQSARADTIAAIQTRVQLMLPATLAQTLHTPIVPIVATAAVQRVVASNPTIADAYGLNVASASIGMNPDDLRQAWNLGSTAVAQAILGGDPGSLGATVSTPPQTTRVNTTIDAVANDTAGLARLAGARNRVLDNANVKLGGA